GMRHALDIGTGSGVIALMLAQRSENLQIDAVEIHPDSVLCAQDNVRRSPWADQIRVWETAIQNFQGGPYDLIVSNPPFFSEMIVSPDEHRRRARATGTLNPGELIGHTRRLLAPEGIFCVILPVPEGRKFQELAATKGLYCNVLLDARTRPNAPPERSLLQFSRSPLPFKKSAPALFDAAGRFVEPFAALVEPFYLG
ncbi:MAG: tRNA1(Val) (adenine(37)-N6)-methyltransferase, partial [Saprospiraceae bacterium]